MKSILYKLISYLLIQPMKWLSFKLEIRKYKKIIKIEQYSYLCLHYRIRNLLELKISGYDSKDDELVFFSISKVLNLDFSEEDLIKLSKIEDKVNIVINLIKKDQRCLSLIDISAKLRNKLYLELKKDFVWINRVLPTKPLVEDIDFENLNSLMKIIKEKYQSDIDQVYDRSTYKISFSYAEIGNIITIVTPIIFIGGYLHSKLYFNHFGININHFFSISDYITVSIDAIKSALIGAVLALGGILVSLIDFSMNVSYLTSQPIKKKKRIIYHIFILVFLILTIYKIYINDPGRFSLLNILTIVISFQITDIVASKYFKDTIKAMFLVSFTLIFFCKITIGTYEEIDRVEINYKNPEIEIKFKTKYNLSKYECLPVIGFSSDYIYLLDTINSKSITISKKKLLLIKTTNSR